jgi:hypothetical protein
MYRKAALSVFAAAMIVVGFGMSAASADEIATADDAAPVESSPSITSITEAVTVGYVTPTYGAFGTSTPSLGTTNAGQAYGFSSSYMARGFGASLGVFGQFTGRQAFLSYAPAQAWNFGASVGYAGFYLRGGVSDAPLVSPLFRDQGWEAGVGYGTDAFDLRLMMISQTGSTVGVSDQAPNSQQWTIGGMYQISQRLRLNADAFYGARDLHGLYFALPAAAAAQTQTPQGTGARVGIQLRF